MSDSSSTPVGVITNPENAAMEALVSHVTKYVRMQCIAANSDWPMAEEIYLVLVFRCPLDKFDAGMDVFQSKTADNRYYAATAQENSDLQVIAIADENLFELFISCLHDCAPESAITSAEIIQFAYA